MCTYLLVFYLSRFSGLTVPQNPFWRAKWFGKSGFSVIHIWMGCKVTVQKCHNMAHVSQFIATELNVSVCYYYLNCYFADDLTQNLPQLCFICYWRHPDSLWPQPAVTLRWGDINRHSTHHGAELSGGWASVCICKCSHNIPFEAMTHFLMP